MLDAARESLRCISIITPAQRLVRISFMITRIHHVDVRLSYRVLFAPWNRESSVHQFYVYQSIVNTES